MREGTFGKKEKVVKCCYWDYFVIQTIFENPASKSRLKHFFFVIEYLQNMQECSPTALQYIC